MAELCKPRPCLTMMKNYKESETLDSTQFSIAHLISKDYFYSLPHNVPHKAAMKEVSDNVLRSVFVLVRWLFQSVKFPACKKMLIGILILSPGTGHQSICQQAKSEKTFDLGKQIAQGGSLYYRHKIKLPEIEKVEFLRWEALYFRKILARIYFLFPLIFFPPIAGMAWAMGGGSQINFNLALVLFNIFVLLHIQICFSYTTSCALLP